MKPPPFNWRRAGLAQEIEAMIAAGRMGHEIAAALGVSLKAVYSGTDRLGIRLPRRMPSQSPATIKRREQAEAQKLRGAPIVTNRPPKPKPRPKHLLQPPKHPREDVPTPADIVTERGRWPEGRHCKWLLNAPADAAWHWCGAAAEPGRDYCAKHHARAYAGPLEREAA